MATLQSGPSSTPPPPLVEYKGNCHCGTFIFSFTAPQITKANTCDCSICIKNGYIWSRTEEGSFTVLKGDEDALVGYVFGQKLLVHKFCPTCGTSVIARMQGPDLSANHGISVLVNLRAISEDCNLNVKSLPPGIRWNTSKVGTPYQHPPHVDFPTADATALVYHGSCHCGAVRFAVQLDTKISTAKECNCSICWRDGSLWIYPPTERITWSGRPESVTEYTFRLHKTFHGFCKHCGIALYERFLLEHMQIKTALNVRTLEEIESIMQDTEFTIEQGNGKGVQPLYVVPS
ncbi:Glutathione-dependent formaldehyde-activating [Mycena kentingensis (nom. inval.)]|nr:Glutathione-dependent formaldehyde-activating [Mycena kentingensis (nom. inval.)]